MFTVNWFNTTGINNFQKYLSRYKDKPNLIFLEVGTYEGQATVWLLENILTHPSSKIYCLDTFEGGAEHQQKIYDLKYLEIKFRQNVNPWIDKIIIKKGFSQETLKTITDRIDFAYIDGSHQAADVLEDAILSFRLLKQYGIMIFDDYKWGSGDPRTRPGIAIDAFIEVFGDKFNVLEKEYQVVIEKISSG